MTVDILRGDTAALPACENAAALLPCADETLTLACTDENGMAALRVLRTLMDYGYAHAQPERVVLICADEAVYKSYRFQWNMWFVERKPTHEDN